MTLDEKPHFVLNCSVALRLVPSYGTVGRQHYGSRIYTALLAVLWQSKVGGKPLEKPPKKARVIETS